MQRRQLLQLMASAGLSLPLARLWAAPNLSSQSPRLLVVFLRGAYDAANVVVPYASPFYYEARPNIALARPDAQNADALLALDAQWGLHPALKDSLYPLWQGKQLAFVPFCGSNDMSRSHFETQDLVESGWPADGSREFGSGFLNRLAQELGASAASPIAFTDNLPLIMQGSVAVPNLSLKGDNKNNFNDRQVALFSALYKNQPLEGQVNEGLALKQSISHDDDAEQMAANRNALTAKGFELEVRRMAHLMRERFNLGFIDVGGWDTHVNEGAAQGALANNLRNLGQGLAAFSQEMGDQWGQTVVVVLSEFGRTFRENGARGTDHGHGTVYWVLGGGVRGGQIFGQQAEVNAAQLNQNRDYQVLNEGRGVLGGLMRTMYGLSPSALARVFPQSTPLALKLV